MKHAINAVALAIGLLLSFRMAAAAPQVPVVVDIGRQVHDSTREVVTPHIPWAVPYARGRLRALFISHQNSMREVVELAQRLDMDYEFFGSTGSMEPYYCRGGYYKGDEPGAKRARLERLLALDYDVIVLGNVWWTRYPRFARRAIIEKVSNGTGLIRIVTGHAGGSEDELIREAGRDSIPVPKTLAAGVPWQALPVFRDYRDDASLVANEIAASRHGKGRFVRLMGYKPGDHAIIAPGFVRDPLWHRWCDYWWIRNDIYRKPNPELAMPITDIRRLDVDYNFAWLIRVMLFAAQKEPLATVLDRGLIHQVPRENLAHVTFTVANRGPPDVTAEFALRDGDNHVLATGRRNALVPGTGGGTVSFPVSAIPAGTYFADLWIRRRGAVVGFGSKAIRVTSETRFRSVRLARDHFRRDEVIAGVLEIEDGKARAAGGSTLTLEIRQRDSHGRQVRRDSFAVRSPAHSRDGHVTFRFNLDPDRDPLTVWQFLEIDLLRGDALLDRRRVGFTLSDLHLDDTIRLGAWDLGRMSYTTFHVYDRLYGLGFDSTGRFIGPSGAYHDYFGIGPHSTFLVGRFEMATLANLRFMPPMARIADYGIAKWSGKTYLDHEKKRPLEVEPHVRYPCVNDPKYIAAMERRARQVVAHYGPHSTTEYFFDQEPCFSQPWHRGGEGVCYCAYCAAYHRDYLERTYGNVAAVNAEYGTDWEDFRDVRAVKLPEAKADRALGPQWVDYRLAMADSFSNFYQRLTDVVQSVQANARTGDAAPIYGGFRSGEAVDAWRFSRWTKVSFPYPRDTAQAQMDFADAGALVGRGCWWGPAWTRSREFAGWHPWNDLFEGANFWYCYYGDTSCLIANDLSVFSDLETRLEQFGEIKRGLGKLIHEADRGDSGVAILYSIASIHHWTLTEAWGDVDGGSARYGMLASETMAENYSAWMTLLTDAVGPFRFVSYRELADGFLEKRGFRMLVLPWSQALSPEEVEAVRIFVERGGTVLADLRPGVSDAHGRPCGVSPLDEVFGVTQDTHAPEIRTVAMSLPGGGAAGPGAEIRSKADLSVRIRNGRAEGRVKGDVPLLVHHDYGRGRAILLNFAVDRYLEPGKSGKGDHVWGRQAVALRRSFRHAIRDVPLDRPVRLAPELVGLRHYVYRVGQAEIVGLLRNVPEDWEAYAGRTARPLASTDTSVQIDAPAHVYDARKGRYLGHVSEWTVSVTPGIANVYAILPYEVTGIGVEAPGRAKRGDRVRYRVRIAAAGRPARHVLHVSVFGPDDSERRHYAMNVNAEGGQYAGHVPLAMNERPGPYQLVVTDAATGIEGRTVVIVEP